MYGHHPRYTADNDAAETDVHSAHVNSFSYLLWAAAHFGRQVREHLTTTYNRSLDWTGWANSLAYQVTGPHTNVLLPMGPH